MAVIKKIFLIIFVFVLFVTGCNSPKTTVNDQSKTQSDGVGAITSYNAADLIAMPDKIIFYHKGTSTIINKDSEKYQNIVKMTKARYDGNIDMYLSAISESDIADQKQNNDAVEFVYSNKVEAHWKRVKKVGSDNDSQYNFVYTSLLFPLSGNRNSWMIFLPIQNGPLGPLKSPDDLLKYLST